MRVELAAKVKSDRLCMAYRRCVAFDYLYLGNELMCLSDIQLQDVFAVLGIKRPPLALLAPLKTIGARFKATELSTASDEAKLEDVVDFLFLAFPDMLVERSIDCLALHTGKKEAAKQKKREEREKMKEEQRLRAELPLSESTDGIVTPMIFADGDEPQYVEPEVPLFASERNNRHIIEYEDDNIEDEDDYIDLDNEALYEAFCADYFPAENEYLSLNPRGVRGLLPDAADRSVEEVDPLYWDVDQFPDDPVYDDMQTLQAQFAGDNAGDYMKLSNSILGEDEPPSLSIMDMGGRRSSLDALRLLAENQREGLRDIDAYARMQTLRSESDGYLDSSTYGIRPAVDGVAYGMSDLERMRLLRTSMNPEEIYGLPDYGSGSEDDYGRGEHLDSSEYGIRPAAIFGNAYGIPDHKLPKLRRPKLEPEATYGLPDDGSGTEDDYSRGEYLDSSEHGIRPAAIDSEDHGLPKTERDYGHTGSKGVCGLPKAKGRKPGMLSYAERMAAKKRSPPGLPEYAKHMLAVERHGAVRIEPPDTDNFYNKANSTDRVPLGDKPGLGEVDGIVRDLHDPDKPVEHDPAVEGLRGLRHGDDDLEQHGAERADGVGDDDQFPIPSQPGEQIVYLDSMDLEADAGLEYMTCLADGENAPTHAVPRPDAEPTRAYGTTMQDDHDDKEAPTEIMVDSDAARESLASPCVVVSEAEDAASPAWSSVTGAVPAAGEEAIYEYADVATDLSAVPLRCSAPNDSATTTVTDNRRRITLREVPDEATYEFATMRRGTPSAATPTIPERESARRWSKQSKPTKTAPDALAPIGQGASKVSGRRWSKDQKRSKSLATLESGAEGEFEAVSIRLNKGAGGQDVDPEVSGSIAVPRQQLNRSYSRKISFTRRSRRKSGINAAAGPAILDLDAPATTNLGELPQIENADADWNAIQTFLSAVAATAAAETTDAADTTA